MPTGRVYLDRTPAFDGSRLRAMRRRRRVRAETLARRARVSARHIWRLEVGKRPKVAAVTLARIALALRVDLYYLLGLSDEPEPWK